MNKRLIILIGIGALLLAGIGVLLFVAVKKQKQQAVVATGPQIAKVLDEQVISPVASLDKNAFWYFNSEGRLFRVNVDGSGISEFPLPALSAGVFKQALWPKDGHDFIAISGSGLSEAKSFYDSNQKIYINLPANIQSLDWLPDSKRVVYVWKSGDNAHQQLVKANADGTGFQTIKDLFWPDLVVKAGPDANTILLYRASIQGDVNKIYYAKLDTGEIATVVDTGKNSQAAWLPASPSPASLGGPASPAATQGGPSGSRFVFTQNSLTAYPKVYLYDFTTKLATDLALNTILDKIAFDADGKIMYAAVPKKDNSGDVFVKIDLATFKQTTILDPSNSVRAKNLMLVGNTLYFVNSADGKFYSLTQ